jgi:hypothetical protein
MSILLSLALLPAPSAAPAPPAPTGAGPLELIRFSTNADADYSDDTKVNFSALRGALIAVATTGGTGVAGRCDLSVSGAISQPLLLGSAGYVYHSPNDTWRPSSELVIEASPTWGMATLTLSYDASAGTAGSSDQVECAVYLEPELRLLPGTDEVLALSVDPTDLSCDSVDYKVPYDGWLILENASSSDAYGGGGIQLYLDGEGVVEYGVGDTPSQRPSRMAYPVEAAAELEVMLCHEDDTTGDNAGTRAVEITFGRSPGL